MADVIPFPRKTEVTDQEKTVLWVIKVVDHMVSLGSAKECNLHITEQGLKDIEGFKPQAEDIVAAVEYLKQEGAIVL